MSTERLISLLEEIRDQQRHQIANYERALQTQDEAMALQRRGRRTLMMLVLTPWLVLFALLLILLLHALCGSNGLF